MKNRKSVSLNLLRDLNCINRLRESRFSISRHARFGKVKDF